MAEAPLRAPIELAQGLPGAKMAMPPWAASVSVGAPLRIPIELVQGRPGAKTAMPPVLL